HAENHAALVGLDPVERRDADLLPQRIFRQHRDQRLERQRILELHRAAHHRLLVQRRIARLGPELERERGEEEEREHEALAEWPDDEAVHDGSSDPRYFSGYCGRNQLRIATVSSVE